jgi:predicted naringenin-chalcone synthase
LIFRSLLLIFAEGIQITLKDLTMTAFDSTVHIASFALASPPFVAEQAVAGAFMEEHYRGKLNKRSMAVLKSMFSHPSVQRRHFAIEDPNCFIYEDPDKRIDRFLHWATELSAEAASQALRQVGLEASEISNLVINTCTGYVCPGLSTYLIEKMGLSPDVRAYDLVGSGCSGAVANLQLAQQIQHANGSSVTLSIAVEICSATFQMGNDLSLIVSNALFGDGAAAAILWNRSDGITLVDSASYYAPEYRDHIRFVHKNGQLHNQLSVRLPEIAQKPVAELAQKLLAANGLTVREVPHWALHSGGDKVINAVQEALGLTDEQCRPTRDILRDYGNLSSPTVWFVLRKILDSGVNYGDWCMMLAFGAGFSAHAFLFRLSTGK